MMSNHHCLKNRRILVTGAGSGIGRATVVHLHQLGAEVIALSRTASSLDALKTQCPSIIIVCVDLNDWDATRKAVESHLPIQHVVNNAGIALLNSCLEATPDDFDRTFNVNLRAVLNVTQVVAKDLIVRKQKGSVVNISSQAGQRPIKDHLVYCCSKSALDMMTKMMALELGGQGIRVNGVSPTVVMTEMGRKNWGDSEKSTKMMERIPQGRFATEEDVTNAIIYLLGDTSDMVHGTLLPVDGGFLVS